MRAVFTLASVRLNKNPRTSWPSLRRFAAARGWTAVDYVDRGVSGAQDRRPALDHLVTDARRRRLDVVLCWRLDRLGRNLKHLITLLEDLQALGVAFVTLGEGIDTTTPAGRLQLHILGALAEFERARIQERVRAGLARAKAQGVRLGRPRRRMIQDGSRRSQACPSARPRGAWVSPGPPCNGPWPKNPQNRSTDFLVNRALGSLNWGGPKPVVSGPPKSDRSGRVLPQAAHTSSASRPGSKTLPLMLECSKESVRAQRNSRDCGVCGSSWRRGVVRAFS